MISGAASRRRGIQQRSEAGDAAALETDVVRFVAIVGLTLMVIFALVHSLPYDGLEPTPEVELVPRTAPPPDPNLVPVPREELERMARSDAELRDARRRLADTLASQQQVERTVAALEGRVRAVTTELTRTTRELDAARASVAALEAVDTAEDERYQAEIGYLRERVEILEDALRETALEVAGVDERKAAAPSETETDAEHVAGMAPPPDSLVLRFLDDRVYLDLLGDGKIRSYLRIPELDLTYQVFRESPERLRFSLVYRHADGAVYEIPDGTLPDVLRDETRRFDLRLSLRNDLDYLVVLSETIRAQVERLEAAGQVGFYDILANERVVPAGKP
jgi:hypothetical protein